MNILVFMYMLYICLTLCFFGKISLPGLVVLNKKVTTFVKKTNLKLGLSCTDIEKRVTQLVPRHLDVVTACLT
jgi:hypothetical protein